MNTLFDAILNGRHEAVAELLRSAMKKGSPPEALLDQAMIPAMRKLGDLYANGQAVIPDLLLGARAMQAGLAVLEPLLARSAEPSKPCLCIGTVKGDRHGIGKNIVAMMLRAAGYPVKDLGVDCGVEVYLRAVDEGAQAVLCSALMNRSLRYLRVVTEALRTRPEIPVLVGGAPVTADYAAEIGAGYTTDAAGAVREIERLLPGSRPK